MEHLLNCHGELAALISVLSGIPVLQVLIRSLRSRFAPPKPLPGENSP